MATIPLPALHVNPPQPQENLMEQYGRLLQLKNMQAMAPLQIQQAQQQVQAGQLDLQQKQIALKDQQAMSKAMQEWSGGQGQSSTSGGSTSAPNYESLYDLARKNGASFNALSGLQQHILDMKTKAATIAMDDARAGASNAEALKTKNGMLIDAMSGVMNLPDDQIASGLLSSSQELAQKGLLDPPHVQMAQQLAQSGDPKAIRQQLQMQIAGMGGFNKMLDDAQKQVDLAQKQGKSDPNSIFYAPSDAAVAMGTAPKAAEIQEGKAKQAATVAGAEAKARFPYNPTVVLQSMSGGVAGNAGYQQSGGGTDWGKVAQRYGLSQAAFDQQAEKYFQTGTLPPIGRGNANVIAQNRDLMNRAAELHPGASLAAGSAEYKANTDSLKSLQKNYDQVQAFENTALKNMDLLQQTAQKIPDLGTRFANVPVRMINANMIGTANMAAFKTALNTAQTEAAKVLNSSNASGVLSDSARHELQALIDGNATYPALKASLDTLRQDMANRHQSYQMQIQDIQNRIGGKGGNQQTQGQSSPLKITLPSGKQISIE